MTDEDVAACYDMSLKDFEHSGVHDLFKICKLLIYIYIYLILLVMYTCVFCLTKF